LQQPFGPIALREKADASTRILQLQEKRGGAA